MIFRKAEAQDLPAILQIYADIHSAEEQGLYTTGWIRDVYPTAADAQNALARDDLFVELDNGRIVASAIINHLQTDIYYGAPWKYPAEDEDVMVLHTLTVSPALSGKGYGKAFEAFYEQYARLRGCHYLRIDTNIRNTRAQAMYAKLGYHEVAVIPCDFSGIRNVRLLLLEKAL